MPAADAFAWAAHADPGAVMIYFEGDLAYTRCQVAREDLPRPAALDVAADMWQLGEGRQVCLTQKRVGPGHFHYVATRTSRRMAA